MVRAYYHTYNFQAIITNCSNNYGPFQFPEKLIPQTIYRATLGQPIPVYGDGTNVRDWLYVEDHVDALLLAACKGEVGLSYCVGGHGERTNKEVVHSICNAFDQASADAAAHAAAAGPPPRLPSRTDRTRT